MGVGEDRDEVRDGRASLVDGGIGPFVWMVACTWEVVAGRTAHHGLEMCMLFKVLKVW